MDAPASQASSHFPLEPISAEVLATNEQKRRDHNKSLGLIRTGCDEIDDQTLLGGLERGSVVGLSAEDEDMGSLIGIQALTHSLVKGKITKAMIITPKPIPSIAGDLRNAFKEELESREDTQSADDLKSKLKSCLDSVMLSCVFDIDGLWEVLSELDPITSDEQPKEPPSSQPEHDTEVSKTPEVQDSDDDLTPPPSDPIPPHKNDIPPSNPPDLILITHFSSLLHTLFTHRSKPAAHSSLQLLSSHIRYLSRNLPSNPLILLLNSTTSHTTSLPNQPSHTNSNSRPPKTPLDPTLRSIFNPPTLDIPGYHNLPSLTRKNKPTFGLVFSQVLDVHLLCTKVVRGKEDADVVFGGAGVREEERRGVRYVTVVEVLMDEFGVWEGSMGVRRGREQRWGAVDVDVGRVRVRDAFEEKEKGGKGGDLKDIRVVAGFGGPAPRRL